MIVSFKHRFMFVHNPKAGGTSVRQILGQFHDMDIQFWHQGWSIEEQRVVDMAHLTADQWAATPEFEPLFKFGFVRNPYSRFWSSLNEFMRRHSDSFPRLTVDDLMLMLTPASIRHDWRFVHFCPQHAFFYIGNQCLVDWIGVQEVMDDSWAKITALTGSIWDATLPKERESGPDRFPKMWREDKRLHFLINRLYHRDFLLFRYFMHDHLNIQNTHADRIEVIHDPMLASRFHGQETGALDFTPGEKKSLEQVRAMRKGAK
jgi:hypothetical protein